MVIAEEMSHESQVKKDSRMEEQSAGLEGMRSLACARNRLEGRVSGAHDGGDWAKKGAQREQDPLG